MIVPFNKPCLTGKELHYISESVLSGQISGDGIFTQKCQKLLEETFDSKKVFMTTSCTDALEMASILINLNPGDEVIVPSFTFVSTVNAFYLRAARPVFVDIRKDTLNLDEALIEEKVTERTKAIFPVHYAGVACEMDEIMKIAHRFNLYVVEDAAHGMNATYNGKYLGTIGDFGAFSFHETKNFTCGEGGALIINDEKYIERAEIVREKGTNRSKFFRGEVDKYTWVDIGSSFLPSDVLSAFLFAQLEYMGEITEKRKRIYNLYYDSLIDLQYEGKLILPFIPENCTTSYHMFYILLPNENERNSLMEFLKGKGVHAIFHYIPLHSSPIGESLGYKNGDLPVTEEISQRILRLPFYNSLTEKEQIHVIESVKIFFKGAKGTAEKSNNARASILTGPD
ncbi:MAG: dTDP-4-amino-4,6-dideoxygalactose transaminase [bacterium]